MDSDGNRRVTSRELNDKLDIIRGEQKVEHTKTRALVIAFGIPSMLKVAALVGVIQLPHIF